MNENHVKVTAVAALGFLVGLYLWRGFVRPNLPSIVGSKSNL